MNLYKIQLTARQTFVDYETVEVEVEAEDEEEAIQKAWEEADFREDSWNADLVESERDDEEILEVIPAEITPESQRCERTIDMFNQEEKKCTQENSFSNQ